jgi:hypothetical protein
LLKISEKEIDNFTYGEVFESDAPRSSRPSRSTAQFRISYNEDLMAPNLEGDDGDAHPSTFPCANFLRDAGILDDFLLLVNRVGLTIYMMDESNQYAILISNLPLHSKYMISLSPCLWRGFVLF